MSARSGLLRGLRLRNVRPSSQNGVSFSQHQQRRLLNHFTARVPKEDIETELSRLAQNTSGPSPFTLAVKDNIATTTPPFLPTTCASPFLLNYHSPIEATIVSQLRARGAVIVGKTNLDEFGMGSYSTHSAFGPVAQGPDSNLPSDGNKAELFSAGGSSGGSAVAIAEGEADVALGTDTGGSVRLPAAYSGVVGFKPSYGMLSRYGVVPYANSLDTVGLLAGSVETLSKLIVESNLWAEHDPKDPTSLSTAARKRCAAGREGYYSNHNRIDSGSAEKDKPLSGIKFGIPLEYNIQELDPHIRATWADAAKQLQSLGARIVPVSLPSTRHALSAYYVIAPAEASSNLAKYDGVRYGRNDLSITKEEKSDKGSEDVLYASVRGAGFGPEVKRRILLGSYTLSSEAIDNYFIQAQKVRRLVRRDFDRAFRLANPLLSAAGSESESESESDQYQFDLSDLPEEIPVENKFGPTQVDFLLCPTAPTLAPRLGNVLDKSEVEDGSESGEGDGNGGAEANNGKKVVDAYMNDVFTVPASLAGLPAISIPVAVGEKGIGGSAGLQLIGQYWDDARLLSVAGAVMNCLGEKSR
ncbi:glutamyl-tRNA amidotransferase [Naviculisporaceae sp. PSN 640]